MKKNLFHYMRFFSASALRKKLLKYARQAGIKVVYMVLLLFYAYQRNETPTWAKNIVLSTLGYFLTPIDAIPDLTPVIGYTDDLGVLSFGIVTIAAYINEDVRAKARKKLTAWFGNYNQKDLDEIDQKL